MEKILIIDNYDSFTYNIVHLIGELGATCDVFRNDKISIEEVDKYNKIILSPGPGIPSEAGILLDVIKQYAATKSILGICLGHQAIAEVFGATLINLTNVYHGIESEIEIVKDDNIFKSIESKTKVGRYHSWAVGKENFPNVLEITSVDCEEKQIMSLKHKNLDVRGVQFHPESILTKEGKTMLKNWMKNNF